jgi:hypothetical protein
MAKFRTSSHLQAALDNEFGWRLAELSNLKSAISHSEGLRRNVLLRSSIPMAYCHWEGFVKKSAHFYGIYLTGQGLKYKDIHSCFSGLGVMTFVQTLGSIKRRIATASSLVVKIQEFGNENVAINLAPAIDDLGNLSYDMFAEIAQFLDMELAQYETKKNFIDESLIAARNKIAHGERLEIDFEAVNSIFNEVIGLMRNFKADLENAVTAKSYLVISKQPAA